MLVLIDLLQNIYNYNVYLLLFCGLVYSRRLLLVLLGPKMFKNYPNVSVTIFRLHLF